MSGNTGSTGSAATTGSAASTGSATGTYSQGSNAAVVGMDGGVGYPAYSGLLPNPMVTSALITVRESSIAGKAAWNLFDPSLVLVKQPFLTTEDVDWSPKIKLEKLQANVRGMLVEMELMRSIDIDVTKGKASLRLPAARKKESLVTMGRLDDSIFDRQLQLVESFAALRAERSAEILTQVVPQTSHWSAVAMLGPDRHRYTWELIGVGLRFVAMMTMRLKFEFNVLRPGHRSAVIQPMILTPGYTAYPCGHATEACFVAELLPLLAGDPTYPFSTGDLARRPDGLARQLNRVAFRIAENRVVAGLHYPVDYLAGQALGAMLARYLVWLAADPHVDVRSLAVGATAFAHPGQIDGNEQPTFDRFVDEQTCIDPPMTPLPDSTPDAPVLRDLWTLARREWVGEGRG